MRFRTVAIACVVASALPVAAFAADCSAAANVAIAKNLTANWRMLKIDVSSDTCAQTGCFGIVDVAISEHLPRSADIDAYQFSFPYEIHKGSRAITLTSTRRFGADQADKPVLSPSVSKVSCASR